MDFRTLVTKENFKTILHHHLKRQVYAKFANIISKDIQGITHYETTSSDSAISSISSNLTQSDAYKEFSNTFLKDLDHLFADREKYIPKEDIQGAISQCSSVSSVNTSIDYISCDQFQDIIQILSNGINAEKLEALETLYRLPSLEHIIKQTLWPSVETALHKILLSDVTFLKEFSLKIYTKMLSSSESKVVQESFNSLIKHVVHNLLPSISQNADFLHKCKSVVEIIAIINKFLQNIPNHWLRYPQHVIENITVQSLSILSYGSKHSKVFPIWLCVALCDKKSKWLKNILHGHVSRAYLIDALQKDPLPIKLAVQFCDNFILNQSLSWIDCCQSSTEVTEITHIICFLAYLLKYAQGREMFTVTLNNVSYAWMNVLDLIMKCTIKLCSVSCFSCCKVSCSVLSTIWCHIWPQTYIPDCYDSLLKMLNSGFEHLSKNSLCFVTMCLCNIPCDILQNIDYTHTESILDCMSNLFKQLTSYSYDLSNASIEMTILLTASLTCVKKILSEPSDLFFHLNFKLLFCAFIHKMADLSRFISCNYAPGTKTVAIQEFDKNISNLFISLLQKPSLSIFQNTELLEITINVLLEKILEDIKSKGSVCKRDVSVLSVAFKYNFTTKSINKSVIFKLSSVIWQFDTNSLQNLPEVKSILETLIPSIFPYMFQSQILLDENADNPLKLFHYILLFPSLTNQGFFMDEEYILLSLQVLSLLACSILSVCYLEANYKLTDILFKLQSECDENAYIIDSLSVIQNHLLIKLCTVGGPNERFLPPETLYSVHEGYNWPLVKNYPVPEVYYHILPKEKGDWDVLLSNELNNEIIKNIFYEYIENDLMSLSVISHLLKYCTSTIHPLSRTLNFISLDDINIVLQDEIVVGLKLTKRYGEILHLINEDNEKSLEKLLMAGKCLLSSENKLELDLFICTTALIFRCDVETTWSFLETFSKCPVALIVWSERMLQAGEENAKYVTLFHIISEYCDLVVKQTLPCIFSAFQFSNTLPSVLFEYWIRHCFWNCLDFTEIAQFVLTVALLGEDYAIYFFVSLLKHKHDFILKNAHNCNVITLLKMNPISGYKLKNYIGFMDKLSHTYKSRISKHVTEILCEESID